MVIPLLPEGKTRVNIVANLNSLLRVAGAEYRLMTTHMAGIRRSAVGALVANIQDQRALVVDAIDFLLQGF